MKTVSTAMANHLKEGATTLTTCWIITRTDGKIFYYTELDEDIEYEGNVYRSAAGFNKSAITSSATFAVDKLEVTGFLRDDGITDDEIRNGAFDHASVEVFMINYVTPSMGKIRLRAGWFGEVRTTGSGAFLVELRGLVDQLQVKVGRTYLPECDVDLGSPKCGIKLVPDIRKGGQEYKVGNRVVWPIDKPDYIASRHYPQIVDPNIPGVGWPSGNIVKEDLNVSPVKGPSFLRVSTTGIDATMTLTIPITSFGLSPDEITSGLYKLTFRSKYFRYNSQTNGSMSIRCQRLNGTIYQTVATGTTIIPSEPPRRQWVDAVVDVELHPQTTRIQILLTVSKDPDGVLRSRLCFDDLDISVSYRAEQIDSFALYGGVEFECLQDGITDTLEPPFDPVLGEQTNDGTVIWQAVEPQYTHLRALTDTMTLTNTIKVAPIALPWDSYFDWGVVKFLTGPNAGRAMEIQSFDAVTGTIILALPLPYRGLVGDMVSIQAGCNKTLANCKLFKNVMNFRGFPRVPGQGQYFKVAGL